MADNRDASGEHEDRERQRFEQHQYRKDLGRDHFRLSYCYNVVTVLSLTLSVITLSTAKSMITFAGMTTKKPVVLVRFQPDVKDALNDAASKDGRSLSSLLEKIAVDWLRINGRPEIELRGPKKRRPEQ
ncbi:MAG: hypothetical protein WAN05_00355 [Roseiarcus sp.]